jgi:hypothetical protein
LQAALVAERSFGRFPRLKHSTNSNLDRASVIQLVPLGSVEPNGVADYAQSLARALRNCQGIDTVFLSGTPSTQEIEMKDEWQSVCVPSRQPQILADTLGLLLTKSNASAVVLHFSGYGYQKRGVPLWLLHGLRMWKSRNTHVSILTIFHELYATGRPWRSSFWLSRTQKRIARGILDLSSGAITPTSKYRNWLQHCNRGHAEIACMPVFSNIGEPGSGAVPCARSATAVVFGLAGVEDRIYGGYRQEVEHALKTLGVERVLDIGPRIGSLPPSLVGVPVISKGALPQAFVSELLQRAKFGFIAYPLDVIGKSGVFAAYAAHGVVPIVFSEKPGLFEGLEPGRHYIDGIGLDKPIDADALASMQSELSSWYASHSVHVQAELLGNVIMRKTRNADGTLHV